MKILILLFSFSIFAVSCSQYQFLTISGVNVSKLNDEGFTAENDTVKVNYRFSEYGGKLGITLYNKTSQPIEIDWRKSAMIINNDAVSYFDPNGVLMGSIDTNLRGRALDYSGNIQLNEPSQFIPPNSSIYKETFLLKNRPHSIDQVKSAIAAVREKGERKTIYSSKRTFHQQITPGNIRSYLTIRTEYDGSKKENVIEHFFYISEVDKRMIEISDFSADQQKRGDRFYFQP